MLMNALMARMDGTDRLYGRTLRTDVTNGQYRQYRRTDGTDGVDSTDGMNGRYRRTVQKGGTDGQYGRTVPMDGTDEQSFVVHHTKHSKTFNLIMKKNTL